MKTLTKLFTMLLVLIMLVQSTVIGTIAVSPLDIDTESYYASETGYTSANDVEYRKSGSYIYNWGAREEVATFLSPNAISFYTSGYTYDVLSLKSGGTSQSNAPSSALYTALKDFMTSKHKKITTYAETRPLYQYTDCEMNGNKISSFYSGVSIGPAWDSGATWNREHTWPNSKGTGNSENDIMMLRPTSVSENSSRGNKAYGKSSGFYNPNSESNGAHDLRGDVSRICLYVYVRWGDDNKNNMWGSSGVIESLSVLLGWMEADPVDTWEMGRNDAVQSITGTRNVFVDYPEYAWLIFGKEVPSDMVTPSGEAQSNAHHYDNGTITTEATCTTTGVKIFTCTDSGCDQTKTETIAALGHNWDEGSITTDPTCTTNGVKTYICSRCNGTKTSNIASNVHSYGDWIIDTEATETSTGLKHRVCSVCDNTESITIPIIGHIHNYSSIVTPSTCTSMGYTTHSCSCGDTYIDSYMIQLSHAYHGGFCVNCGAKDPLAPTYSTEDFSLVMNKLLSGLCSGEERYNKICEAINIYNNLSDDDKTSVQNKYNALKTIIAQYNTDINSTNFDAEEVGNALASIVVLSLSTLSFTAYTLLSKKYF